MFKKIIFNYLIAFIRKLLIKFLPTENRMDKVFPDLSELPEVFFLLHTLL